LKNLLMLCFVSFVFASFGCGKAEVAKVVGGLSSTKSLVTEGESASVLENYEQIIELEYSSSTSTLAESCSITSEVNLSVTTPCSCDSGVCTVGITPGATGVGSFEYSVSKGSTESNSSSYDLTIKTMVPFVSQWNITSGNTIELTLGSGFNYDFSIDWGDGTIENYDVNNTTISHTYGSSNTFTVTISGLFEALAIESSSRSRLTSVTELGTVGWKTLSGAFMGCANLTTVSGGDTSEVTNMSSMFLFASQAVPDTSTWNTTNVTNMRSMFELAGSANPNTSGWDTSKVTDMSNMFNTATSANPNTSGWDTSSVATMEGVFAAASVATPNTSGWDTSSVTNMKRMFYQATLANPDTSSWDTSQVTTMEGMFAYTNNANPNTTNWDTSNVTTMKQMFKSAAVANPNTSGWITASVTDMWDMFENSGAADPDMSGWDFSSVTIIFNMFESNTTLSTANYDNLLVQLDQTASSAFSFDAGNATYTIGGAGDTARQSLIAKSWGFTDGGGI